MCNKLSKASGCTFEITINFKHKCVFVFITQNTKGSTYRWGFTNINFFYICCAFWFRNKFQNTDLIWVKLNPPLCKSFQKSTESSTASSRVRKDFSMSSTWKFFNTVWVALVKMRFKILSDALKCEGSSVWWRFCSKNKTIHLIRFNSLIWAAIAKP